MEKLGHRHLSNMRVEAAEEVRVPGRNSESTQTPTRRPWRAKLPSPHCHSSANNVMPMCKNGEKKYICKSQAVQPTEDNWQPPQWRAVRHTHSTKIQSDAADKSQRIQFFPQTSSSSPLCAICLSQSRREEGERHQPNTGP